MSNSTDPVARAVHGTNPQFLIDKVVRVKAYETFYWKEECFALTAATVIDKAVNIKYVGGTVDSTRTPSPFLCLVLKQLQIQPDLTIVHEYIKSEHKYLKQLGLLYLRLVGTPVEIYKTLEAEYSDYRKVVLKDISGIPQLVYIDELVDLMQQESHVFGITLPRLTKREILEEQEQLGDYESAYGDLEEIIETMKTREQEESTPVNKKARISLEKE